MKYNPDQILIAYGSLRPGESNFHIVSEIRGEWIDGTIRGELKTFGKYLRFNPSGQQTDVPVQILISEELPKHWQRLDEFEGSGYQRVQYRATTSSGALLGSVYIEPGTYVPLRELTEYVVAKHHSFLRRELPRISELFRTGQDEADESSTIFATVRTKIEAHLGDEEQFLFPITLCIAASETPDPCGLDLKVRLQEMEREHDNAGIALEKCRDLINGGADTSELVDALNSLIADLAEHVRIENTYIHPLLKKYL